MQKSSFQEATDINQYLVDSFNYKIYSTLVTAKAFSLLYYKDQHIDELSFFNLLYEQYEVVIERREKPLQLIEHLNSLVLNKIHKAVLLIYLTELLEKQLGKELESSDSLSFTYYQLKFCQELIEKEAKSLISAFFFQKFDIQKVEKHIKALPTIKEKMKYVLEIQNDFNQITSVEAIKEICTQYFPISFDKQCVLLLDHLKQIEPLELVEAALRSPTPKLLISGKRGAKINIIRIFNSMYELDLIQLPNEQYPSKELFMKSLGELLGTDLSDYQSSLNQTYKWDLETNLKIFEDLKKTAEDNWKAKHK